MAHMSDAFFFFFNREMPEAVRERRSGVDMMATQAENERIQSDISAMAAENRS